MDTFSEKIEVCDVSLDFRDGQVDEHTSDLRSILLSNKLGPGAGMGIPPGRGMGAPAIGMGCLAKAGGIEAEV